MPIKVLAISDSPKLTTGFANVANQIYKGFQDDPDIELEVFGMLDFEPDVHRKLDYPFWPTSPMDPMGYNESIMIIQRINPDIVWIMMDPGNLTRWVAGMLTLKQKYDLKFKIFAYPPIEGAPTNLTYVMGFETIFENGGTVVTWTKSASDLVSEISNLNLDYIYFGADHADFRPYSPEHRHRLREVINWDNAFVVGQIGVNKRTKGYDKMIYTARALKDMGVNDVLFYGHCEPDRPTLQGYDLLKLAKVYDVNDMILWKPDRNMERGSEWKGVDRSNGSNWQDLEKPETPEERKDLFTTYSFIDRMNCLDMYLDFSQVEGWGLPQGEAMSCGVPTFVPLDYHVRDELFAPGAYSFETTPPQTWDTWHTGARLVGMDPEKLAYLILMVKENPADWADLSVAGQKQMKNFKWDETRRQMVAKVKELYGKESSVS